MDLVTGNEGFRDSCQVASLVTEQEHAVSCAQGLPASEKIRIVEVGSGFGGTSAPVMQALAEFADRVVFVYTDISPQLVAYGHRTYGPSYPFAQFRLLDVEESVDSQVRLRAGKEVIKTLDVSDHMVLCDMEASILTDCIWHLIAPPDQKSVGHTRGLRGLRVRQSSDVRTLVNVATAPMLWMASCKHVLRFIL